MPPKFSIIVPAYNEEKYIRKTLHGIKNQTFQDYEVILVTNGCTDKTEELAKKRADEKLRVLSLPKPNVSVARNAGALNAQGNILLFLDADTLLAPDSLQKINEQFTEEYSVATTKALPDTPELKYALALKLKNFYNTTKIYQGCSGALICRKEEFQKAEGYNPEIALREHRKLILKLKEFGEFKCIDTSVTTSMRRFKQWGLSKALLFWAKQWGKDHFGNLNNSEYEKIR